MKIVVAGAGAFGTGLAIALARQGGVALWGRDADHMEQMRADRINEKHLPGCAFPDSLEMSSDADIFRTAEIVLLCMPTQRLASFLRDHEDRLSGRTLIACCKGLDLTTGEGPAEVVAAHVPTASVAVLTGPSFAIDIAQGLPTALTLACRDADLAEELQEALTRPTLRLYRTTDVTGAQLGGALKNVMAIAAGATMGSGLGESARAAVITRGYAEMQRFAVLSGAEPETLMGLSGLGDLLLTCTSPTSRNYSFGVSLGKNTPFDPNKTVEGMHTAAAIAKIAKVRGLDLPISCVVDDLAQGRATVAQALRTLLSRPLKEE